MSEERGHVGGLTRRKALKRIAGTAGAAAAFPILSNGVSARAACASAALHISPGPSTYTARFFNADQMEALAALAETIIPADEHSPGARAARVEEFIDTIIAESSAERKSQWTEGIAAVNRQAQHKFQKPFEGCTPEQQGELMRRGAANEEHPSTPGDHFFVALKNATIEGYYTSSIGIHQELKYQGNTALGEFEGCQHMPHKKPAE
jgi:gluconate 2-dehydrogenase gamma chain